jgi:hypothetical protein
VYGMLHTVRGSTTMATVMLTRAGVGEGRSGQTKGNAGGSTCAWHLEPERRQGPGIRRSVVGGSARPCHLLARSSAPRRGSIRGRASRMERLSVRQLGTPAGAGQGSLNLGDPIGGNEPAPALLTQQRHPQRDPMASSVSGRPRNSGRVWVQFRPLTREGDVGPAGADCPDEVRDWSMPPIDPDRHVSRKTPCSGAEGDVQGDVGRSCCVRMCIPGGVACRARSAAGTAS